MESEHNELWEDCDAHSEIIYLQPEIISFKQANLIVKL